MEDQLKTQIQNNEKCLMEEIERFQIQNVKDI